MISICKPQNGNSYTDTKLGILFRVCFLYLYPIPINKGNSLEQKKARLGIDRARPKRHFEQNKSKKVFFIYLSILIFRASKWNC